MKFELWNPANEFSDREEYVGALVGVLMTLGGQRIKAIFQLLSIEWDCWTSAKWDGFGSPGDLPVLSRA